MQDAKMDKDEVQERILEKLDDLQRDLHRLEVELKVEITTLKTRSRLWGGLLGLGGGGAGVAVAKFLEQLLGKG